MLKSLGLLIRLTIIISRDMFTGLIMGICSALMLFYINPGHSRTVALLMPIGVAAGFFKGMAKVFFLTLSGTLPTTEYTSNYPRFKILGFWLFILLGTFLYVFGLKFNLWISEPLRLLRVNSFIGADNSGLWVVLFSFVFIIGLISYFLEIPFSRDEQFSSSEHKPNEELSSPEEENLPDNE